MNDVATGWSEVLADLRVVDLSSEIAGAYLTKLLAGAGADVVKVEPPGGDPFRSRFRGESDGRDAALFRYLHGGKRSVVGLLGEAHVDQLLDAADLVVESGWPSSLDVVALLQRRPELVVASVTPYGRRGPWADRPSSDFVVQAESGLLAWHGHEDQPPYQSGGRLIDWTAGTFAAVGALAAVRRARATGHGEHVDCSLQATGTYTSTGYLDAQHILTGPPDLSRPARRVQSPSIEPTADGWVGLVVQTGEQFERFLLMIDRPDLVGAPEWARGDLRSSRIDEWNEIVHAWTRQRTTAEIISMAESFRLPIATVNDGRTVFDDAQVQARQTLVTSADGDFTHPAVPYLVDGERIDRPRPAPRLGEHDGAVDWSPRPPVDRHEPRRRPLEGIRVLDASLFWAGPSAGEVLALLGAEVIHLESVERIDSSRTYVFSQEPGEPWWETGYVWLFNNHDKRDLTASLADERGLEIVHRLLRTCDVVLENFAPRVFERFGLDAARVRAINPAVVFARMPAFGLTGPARDGVAFAQTVEQLSGMCSVTGHVDGTPACPRGPCDTISGYHAAFAILAALARREVTGEGASIEVPLMETGMAVAAEIPIEYSAYGRVLGREGNRSLDAAPQGLYACAGREQWLALSVLSDEQWEGLKAALGHPGWTDKPELDAVVGRREAHDLIDDELASWAADQDLAEAVERLLAHGVPAGAVVDPRTMMEHPQLRAFGYYEPVTHPVVGQHLMPTIPFRYRSIDRWTSAPAPALGQDNVAILTELGYRPDEIDALDAAGVIGTRPVGA